MCLSHDLSTYLCFFCHISIKLFEILTGNYCGVALALFCTVGLGGHFEIPISLNMHGVNLKNCGNVLDTFCTEMRNLISIGFVRLSLPCWCSELFSPSCMDTEVSSQHTYISVYCCHLLLRFVSTYTYNVSIASFNFMYRVIYLYGCLFGCL